MAIIGNMRVVVKINSNTKFYGKKQYVNVIEDTFTLEYDKRKADEIAPSGIHAKVLADNREFDITLTRRILQTRFDRNFAWDFILSNGSCYEITITFDADGKIKSAILDEWGTSSDFYDDCDPIATYEIKDFEQIEY